MIDRGGGGGGVGGRGGGGEGERERGVRGAIHGKNMNICTKWTIVLDRNKG